MMFLLSQEKELINLDSVTEIGGVNRGVNLKSIIKVEYISGKENIIAYYNTDKKCNEVIEEIAKRIENGTRLYVLPEV